MLRMAQSPAHDTKQIVASAYFPRPAAFRLFHQRQKRRCGQHQAENLVEEGALADEAGDGGKCPSKAGSLHLNFAYRP